MPRLPVAGRQRTWACARPPSPAARAALLAAAGIDPFEATGGAPVAGAGAAVCPEPRPGRFKVPRGRDALVGRNVRTAALVLDGFRFKVQRRKEHLAWFRRERLRWPVKF